MSLTPGLNLPFGIQPVNAILIDSWAGPYDSVSQANESIPSSVRIQTRFVNIIDIDDSNKGKLYWYKDGILDSDLIPFIDNEIHTGNYQYYSSTINNDTPGDWRIYSDVNGIYFEFCTVGNLEKGAGTWTLKHVIKTTQDTNTRITGTHAGVLGDMSFTNDYLYICVQTGNDTTAIWKKASLTESI